jgi:hypothetical protein
VKPSTRTLIGAAKAGINAKAKARRKLDRLRQMSADGVPLIEAAQELDTTVQRLKWFLDTHEHSNRWPIAGCEPKDQRK